MIKDLEKISSPDKHRARFEDSTDATATTTTVYSASAVMRNSEQNINKVVVTANIDPKNLQAEGSVTALKAVNSKSEVGSR